MEEELPYFQKVWESMLLAETSPPGTLGPIPLRRLLLVLASYQLLPLLFFSGLSLLCAAALRHSSCHEACSAEQPADAVLTTRSNPQYVTLTYYGYLFTTLPTQVFILYEVLYAKCYAQW